MAKKQLYSPNDIENLLQDWGLDVNDSERRPYSGSAVQKFIKGMFAKLIEALEKTNEELAKKPDIVTLTKAEWDYLVESNQVDPNVFYGIYEETEEDDEPTVTLQLVTVDEEGGLVTFEGPSVILSDDEETLTVIGTYDEATGILTLKTKQ